MNSGTVPCDRIPSGVMEQKLRGRRVGDATDAGRLCTTVASPEGVSGDTFRYYVRRLSAPSPVGAVWDARSRRQVSVWDLDAVARWHASRPGQGARTDLDRVEE